MKMEHFFFKSLDENTSLKVLSFLEKQQVAIEQYPGWPQITGSNQPCIHYTGFNNQQIVCYAQINESPLRIAEIQFGPVFANRDVAVQSILNIHEYYRKRHFMALKIQLWIPAGTDSEFIDQNLSLQSNLYHFVSKNENWSTLQLNLSSTDDELFKNFSKGHKSAIKKAQKAGLKVVEAEDQKQIEAFCEIFIKMNRSRNIPVDHRQVNSFFSGIHSYLKKMNMGVFLNVVDASDTVIGGIVLIRQNDVVRYFKGAADPDSREIPVLHCAIWEAVKFCRKWDARIFDLWGYCLLADQKDQRYNINIFKKGFGGELVIYPKTLYLLINPVMYFLYRFIYRGVKSVIVNTKKRILKKKK